MAGLFCTSRQRPHASKLKFKLQMRAPSQDILRVWDSFWQDPQPVIICIQATREMPRMRNQGPHCRNSESPAALMHFLGWSIEDNPRLLGINGADSKQLQWGSGMKRMGCSRENRASFCHQAYGHALLGPLKRVPCRSCL